MTIDPAAHVPDGVIARVRRTSLLGERIVDFVVPDGLSENAPMLKNGAMISDTVVRPDLEDLVKSGSAALAPVAAGELATLVDEGAKGFGSSGQDIRTLIGNLHDIVHAYAGRTGDIESVISSMNQLNSTLAQHAPAQGLSLVNTDKALRSLREQMPVLKAAIIQLDRLAVGGRSVLQAHSDEMSHFFTQMRTILGVLRAQQGDIENLLKYAPLHNRNTQLVEYAEFNQVLQDFVICGLNDDPSDPARRCTGGTNP
jgi:phospholipid/cholesterol/gamma-HCH transport system substrate-binding protein